MRKLILMSAAAIALAACETTPARVAEHRPTGQETAQRGTAMQVTLDKVSNPEGRLANAQGALRAAGSVAGKRVLLVDDILSSGATAYESARALRAAGAAFVGVLTLAHAEALR